MIPKYPSLMETVYKVIGPQRSISEYNAGFRTRTDWSALYLQFTEEHARETLSTRWEKYDLAKLARAKINPEAKLFKVTDPIMYDITVSGEEKAVIIKNLLGIQQSSNLMLSLGEYDGLLVEEHMGQFELILPHHKVDTVLVEQEIITTYHRPTK